MTAATQDGGKARDLGQVTAHFFALPAEMQIWIVEYLVERNDKRNVSLVCKQMQALMMPYLYRHMELHPLQLDEKLRSIFNHKHPGLSHVQTLRIRGNAHEVETPNLMPVLCRLLKAIPKDALRVFEYATTKPMDRTLNHVLRSRQRRLVNYQHHSSMSGLIHITPSIDELSKITCLQLYLGTKQDCRRAGMLIERMQHMTSLAIHLDEIRLPRSMAADWEETAVAVIRTLFTGTVVRALFTGATLSRRCPNLKALRIENMFFSSAGEVLTTLLALDKLEHLQLFGCNQTNSLYESLAPLQLNLRSFSDELSCNAQHQGTQVVSQISISAFLTSLKTLNTFRIRSTQCDTSTRTFDWTALASRAASIRILEMTDHRGNGPFSPNATALPGFRSLCESATRLQQLSISGPEVSEGEWGSAHGLNVMIDCLRKLPHLRLLKLSISPKCFARDFDDIHDLDDSDNDDDLLEEMRDLRRASAIAIAKPQVKSAADKIFDSLAHDCPHFVALAVNMTNAARQCQGHLGFLRTKQIDLYGKVTYTAAHVAQETLKYHEPCSEIMDSERLVIY